MHRLPTLDGASRAKARVAVVLLALAGVLAAPAAAHALTVSGFVHADEATTPAAWPGCDGSTANVSMSFGGGTKLSTACDASTGAFSFSTTFASSDGHVVIFLDPAVAGARGATFTRNADTTTDITGLTVTLGRVRIRSESGRSVTTRGIDQYDATQDGDIPVSSDGAHMTVTGSTELHVEANHRFVPGGDVSASHVHVQGTWVGWPLQRLRVTGSGTGANCADTASMRPLCIDGAGKLEAWPNHVVSYGGTRDLSLQPATYGRLELLPGSGEWPIVTPAGDVTASTVALGDGSAPVTLDLGTASPALDVYGHLTVAPGAVLTGAGAARLHVRGSLTGAGLVDLGGTTRVEHQPAGHVRLLGTTAGGPAWRIQELLVDDQVQPSWGTSGGVTYNASGTNQDRAEAIARTPDGSILTAGRIGINGGDLAVRRYTAAGALDTGWGSSGMVSWNSGGTQADFANAVVVDEAGNVYAGGTAKDGSGSDWIIRKYGPTGVLDTTWGGAGSIAYNTGGTNTSDRLYNLALDADRNLYAIGTSYSASTGQDLHVRKYTPDGTLDTSWGSSGTISYNSSGGAADLYMGVVVLPDRSLLLCGQQDTNGIDWTIRKYEPTGAIDAGFGSSGSVTYNHSGTTSDICTSLAVMRDGSILAGGYIGTNGTDGAIRKYTATGALDTSFATGGMFTYNSGGTNQDIVYRMSLDQHDNIVATGYQQTNGYDWNVTRLTPQGQYDTTFAAGAGTFAYNSGASTTDAPRGVVHDLEGNITIAGYVHANGNDWAIRRWDAAGNPSDGTAGASATSRVTAGSAPVTVARLVVGQSADPAGTTLDLETNDREFDVDGSVDVTSGGTLLASSTAPFTIGGSFTRAGTFTPGSGTVTFDDASQPSTLTYAGPTTFSGLAVTTPGKQLRFDDVDQTNVTGTLAITGSGCGTGRIRLRSDVTGQQFELNATGTKNVASVDVADSSAVSAISAEGSISGGNNLGWTITSCAPVASEMVQFRADGTTPVTFGSWTTDGASTSVVLAFRVSDADGGETLTPWVEVRPAGTGFSSSCGASVSGVTFSGPAIAAESAGVAYPATVSVSGLAIGTQYHWRACARDAGVSSGWTDTGRSVDFGVTDGPVATPLSPPDGRWVTSRTPTLTARYDDPQSDPGSVSFELCAVDAASPWSSNCGPSFMTGSSRTNLMSGTNGRWAPLSALVEGGVYYWRARGTDAGGSTGPFSTRWMFRVDSIAPTLPGNPRSIRRGLGSIEIAWDASSDSGSGGVTYDVETSLDGIGWSLSCDDTTSLTCTRGGLAGGQKLFFRIRATDAAGNVSQWTFTDDSTQTAWYLRTSVSSALLGSEPNRRATLPPVGTGNIGTRVAHGAQVGWYQVRPTLTTSAPTSATEPPGDASLGGTVAAPAPASPSGAGWIVDDYAGRTVAPGPIQVVAEVVSSNGAGVGNLHCRAWRVATSGGTITAAAFLGKHTVAADAIDGKSSVQTCDLAGLPTSTTFAANEALYVELWIRVTSGGPGTSTLSLTAEDASSWVAAGTPGTPPDQPTIAAPGAGATTVSSPTLSASYAHPNGLSGTVEFELSTDSGFTTVVERPSSATVTTGSSASATVQSTLAAGGTYWIRARAEDSLGRQSAWSAARSFVVNVGPATPTNGGPADGASFTTTTPILAASAFSDPTPGDSHAASQWQVRTSAGSYVSAVADHVSTSSLTSWTVSPPLGPSGYAWRVRYRDSYGAWSAWSTETTFTVTGPGVSISLDVSTLALGAGAPGSDAVGTANVSLSTSNATGYALHVTDESDAWALSCRTCEGRIIDWTGTNSTPTAWSAGTPGGLGLTIRHATGGRLAKWGPGTDTTATDFSNNRFAGITAGTSVLAHSAGSAASADSVVATLRVNANPDAAPGGYEGTVTFTAVANP